MEHIKNQYRHLFTADARIVIGEGWFWLLSGLCHALDQYSGGTYLSEPVTITRVCHSLGTLAVEHHGGDSTTEKIIGAVQLASCQICQICAGREEVGGTFGPAIYTICRKCWILDEKFHMHFLSPHVYSAIAIQKIEAGILVLPDSWFKRHLQILV